MADDKIKYIKYQEDALKMGGFLVSTSHQWPVNYLYSLQGEYRYNPQVGRCEYLPTWGNLVQPDGFPAWLYVLIPTAPIPDGERISRKIWVREKGFLNRGARTLSVGERVIRVPPTVSLTGAADWANNALVREDAGVLVGDVEEVEPSPIPHSRCSAKVGLGLSLRSRCLYSREEKGGMNMIIVVAYMYRDSSNYKEYAAVSFHPTPGWNAARAEKHLRAYTSSGKIFFPEEVGLDAAGPLFSERDDTDPDWHELVGVFEKIYSSPYFNDSRTIEEFVRECFYKRGKWGCKDYCAEHAQYQYPSLLGFQGPLKGECAVCGPGWFDQDGRRILAGAPILRLGNIVVTPGAIDLGIDFLPLLRRHATGDWGDVCPEDARLNDEAVTFGGRVLSAYPPKVWIITEADRSQTTILLPDEY